MAWPYQQRAHQITVTQVRACRSGVGTFGMLCCVMPAAPLPSAPDMLLRALTDLCNSWGESRCLGMPTSKTAAQASAWCDPSMTPARSELCLDISAQAQHHFRNCECL